MKSIAIIHFQPLEKYPPITNLLDYLADINFEKKVYVFTTECPKNFTSYTAKSSNIVIKRFKGIQASSTIVKAFKYFFLYFSILIKLIFTKPISVLYYETLSALPALWYKKINTACKIFIHYHEYTSPEEYKSNSAIIKWLHKQEQKLYSKAFWISHTNDKRLEMFLQDENIKYDEAKHKLMPNYPSKKWIEQSVQTSNNNNCTKFVYIGSLGLNTMYIKEFATFIIAQNGKASWDIYTNQFNDDAINYIKGLGSEYINILGSVNYDEIPSTIKSGNYDVGLIIYNGHIKNYIYNAPNKLFEYLACKIDTWYPTVMLSCNNYANTSFQPFVCEVDFNNLNESYHKYLQTKNQNTKAISSHYYYENVYNKIAQVLSQYNA